MAGEVECGHGHGKCTCKHCDFVNVVKLAVRLAVKGSPEIGNEDLRALQEADLSPLEDAFIAEAGELGSEQVYQSGC